MTPLEETWELRIHLCIIWGAQRQLPFPCECHQARKDTSLNAPFAWRNELCDDFTAIRHEHTLAGPDFPNVLAQTVFQFAKTHAFHHTNVASRSYIVKVRPATEDGTTFTAVAVVVLRIRTLTLPVTATLRELAGGNLTPKILHPRKWKRLHWA